MTDVSIAPESMTAYANNFDNLHGQLDGIKKYVSETACNSDGFTGVFALLRPVLPVVGDIFNESLSFGQHKMADLKNGVIDTVRHFDENEKKSSGLLMEIMDDLEKGSSKASELSSSGATGVVYGYGKSKVNDYVAGVAAKKEQ